MNYSKQKQIILDTLFNNPVHPTAEVLFELIKIQNPNVKLGIATVYRNLQKLSSTGFIRKIEGLENSVHFDHNTLIHYHFICDKCKKVFDVNENIIPDIQKMIESKYNFKILGHDVTFHGICNHCK